MAVYRSPFSKANEPTQEDPYNTDRKRIEQLRKEKYSGIVSSSSSPVVPGKKETSTSEEASKTKRAYDTAKLRILNSNMDQKEKSKQLRRLESTYKMGGLGTEGGLVADAGKLISKVIGAPKSLVLNFFEAGQGVSQNLQSALKEIGDTSSFAADKIGLLDSPIYREVMKALPGGQLVVGGDKKVAAWSDFRKQSQDKDFKLIQTGNKFVDALVDFGVDATLDPTSWLGAGAVNYAGKGGRAALTAKFATKEMRLKYPGVDLNEVMRFGAGAKSLTPEIMKAEGIDYGIKFAGKAIPGSAKAADVIAGRYGVLSNARARTGDLVERSKFLKNVRGKVAPSSRAGLLAVGAGRAGAAAATDEQIIQQIANQSASKYAKGFKKTFYDDALWKAREIVNLVDASDVDRATITNLVEDPIARAAASPELRDLAMRIKAWQDELRDGVNAVYNKFGLDYNASINEIGFVDDYVHHKLTTEAFERIAHPKWKAKGYFRDADLTSTELGQTTGAALFRKYRKGEEFMGEVLQSGSVKEINDIFARKMKDDFNIEGAKFFEDDIVSLMDSYAYSMAAARGREAFVRRALDFGDDVMKVVNKKIIPDGELVAELTAAHKSLVAARNELASKIKGLRRQAGEGAEAVVARATKVLDDKARGMSGLQGRIDKAEQALAQAEMRLIDAMGKAATLSAEKRGAFLQAHGYLLEQVQMLKRAVETNTVEEAMALDEIKKIYRQVFPNAKRVPDNPTKAINAIKRAKGISEPEELRELINRRDAATRQIEEMAESGVGDPQLMNDLLDLETKLSDDIAAFEVLGDVRLKADYAEDGLLYGVWDDLTPRQFDPNVDPRPYRTLDSRPIVKSDVELSTDEIAAARNGFRQDERSVVVHAIDPDEMIDLREPDNWYGFFDNEGPLGDAMANALRQHGIDAEPFIGAWNDLVRGGNFDPMFEEVYPEMSALIEKIGLTGAKIFPEGVVDDDFVVDVFDSIRASMDDIAYASGAPDPEAVGQSMMDAFIRGMVNDFGNDAPVLFPSRVIYGSKNNMADGAYSAVLPDSYGYAEGWNPKDLLDSPTSPVRFAKDDELVQQIMDGSLEQASWDVAQAMDSVTAKRGELAERSAAREALEQEARSIGKQIAGRKGAATKRIKNIEKAYDDYAKTGKFEITTKGGKKMVTREEALGIITKAEAKILKEINKLEEQIATKTGRSVSEARARIREKQARVAALMDEKKVLERWDERTGNALREEIEFLQEAIAVDPPRGYAGLQSRQWSERVGKRMENVRKLSGDGAPETKAWGRLVTQMHAAEAQLAYMDMFDIPNADALLQSARAGNYMGKVVDDVEDGWRLIEGMGVKVPDEVYEIMMPNIRQFKDPKKVGPLWEIVDFMNATFKTYATLTPGFTVRNAISAAFMNTAAGVTIEAQRRGAQAVRAYLKHGPMRIVDGKQVGWLKELNIPADQWEMYEKSLRAAQATSRGLSSELTGPALKGKFGELVLNNKATKFARKANDAVELGVRLPMALDTFMRGADYDQAVNRITRYHFDYDDLSALDEWAKRFVPFWIWTTRNIPLQMTEQLLRPQTYAQYNRLKERNEVGSDVVMPPWMSRLNPIPVGKDWVLTPDLPHLRLEETAAAFADPKKLIGQTYPMYKLLVELGIADKQLALDIPFTDKYEKARGIDGLIAKLGEVTGRDWLGRRDPQTGELTINPRVSYAIGNLLPVVATGQRLTGGALGGKENYQERQLESVLNTLGVPLRKPETRERGELIGRQFNIRDLMNELVRRGLVPKEN